MADFASLPPWNLEKQIILMEKPKDMQDLNASKKGDFGTVITPATELHITISIHFLLTMIEHKDFWQ